MNADQTLKLARRFIELSPDKRRLFLKALQGEGMDFSVLPIAPGVAVAERDQLSYAQRRMWFLWQLDPQGAAYNLPMAVRLHGPLDLAALQHAFDALVARHETLRTRFVADGDDVRQQVDAVAAPLQLRQDSLIHLDENACQAAIETLAEAEALAPFDLASGPLLRVRLLQLATQEHVLLLTLHHIVADGWSMNVLIDEFLRLYDAAVAGTEATLSRCRSSTATTPCGSAAGCKPASRSASWLTGRHAWATTIHRWNCHWTAPVRAGPATVARATRSPSPPMSPSACAAWPASTTSPCSWSCWLPSSCCCSATAARRRSASVCLSPTATVAKARA